MTASPAAHLPAAGALIGRQFELAELTAALDDLQSGRGRLILLTGDAGAGKTSVLEALSDAAELTDTTVLWGRCWEGGGAPAYWPWSQVLRSAIRALDTGASSAYPATVVRYVSELVPELGDGADHTPTLPTTDLAGARAALFDAIVTFLRIRSADGGLVLALEDLHAADEASLRLLRFAARELLSSPILIVGTYRDAEVRSSRSLQQLVSAIARLGRRITLSGLDEDGVAVLVDRTTGGARLAADARAIYDTTGGNPFFVQEVARLLVAEHQLARDVAVTGRLPIPEEVHTLIRRRLEPLAAQAHEVLTLASVLGRDFEVGVLATLAGLAADTLLDVLTGAADLALVEEMDLGRWQFSHALLREALYDDLQPPHRVALHRRAGEAIEHFAGDDATNRASQLAHHFFEAARVGESARAVRYCSLAAKQAMTAMAFEEAGLLNARALEALALSPAVDEGARYELLMGLGQAQQRGGDLALARKTFHLAVKSARVLGAPELLAQAAIACAGFIETGGGNTRADMLEEALAVLPPGDSPLRARVMVLLAHRVKFARTTSPDASAQNWERGWQLAVQGMDMARRVADPQNTWAALWDWHFSASLRPDTLQERSGVADELVELAVASGDRERLVLSRQWRAADQFAAGDVSAVAAELEVARREAEELRMPFLLSRVAMMQASVALFRGELDEGERFAREALRFGERAENADVERAFAWQRGELYLHRGQFREYDRHTRERLDRLGIPLGASNCAWIIVARACFLAGRPEDAAAIYPEMVPMFTPERFVRGQLCCPTQMAQLAWLIQADEGLDLLWDILLPLAGTHVTISPGHSSAGASDRYLALVAALQGRFDDAEAYFDSAQRLNARLGTPLWGAHTLSDHAQMLVRRGRASDRDRARELGEAAAERFARLGMHFWESRARSLLGGHQGATSAPSAPAALNGARLTQEGEYWAFRYKRDLARVRDSKGSRYLARLLRNPGEEIHALDFVVGESDTGAGTGQPPEPELSGVGADDAGAMLDAHAKAAYRRRLEDLRVELEEATANPDLGRAARAEAEMGFLSAELSAAVGLGGRDRRAASDAERARQSVTRAIKSAIERLGEGHPSLGEHLRSTVRTGIFCAYVPDPREPMTWEG